MSTEPLKALLFSLCGAYGVTGGEDSASLLAMRELSKYMPAKMDALHSVHGETGNGPIHILLDAHIDQIGFIVTNVDEDGFVSVAPCGDADKRVLPAAEVLILGRETLYGVFTSTPPHLSKGDSGKVKDFDKLFIDTGLPAGKAKELIAAGDKVVFKSKQRELLDGKVVSPALDDRAGVAAILRCLELLKGVEHGCKISVAFTVQEESTGGGARTSAYAIGADEAISVDVTFGAALGIPPEKTFPLGGGPLIGMAPPLDHGMSQRFIKIAKEKNIPYGIEAMGGKTFTNADGIAFSKAGVRTALISIPQRNMHTAVEVCGLEDIGNTARLMAEYILERGAAGDA
ncbi:MAG: M20/M25/M40 family metallo-hydrolase [Oscillospiraceae bacterium]|nr:M20/M25/M40 family metallo-hydrolase [Oscillospiraceae bacterium]